MKWLTFATFSSKDTMFPVFVVTREDAEEREGKSVVVMSAAWHSAVRSSFDALHYRKITAVQHWTKVDTSYIARNAYLRSSAL
jgi:hypothetical protein